MAQSLTEATPLGLGGDSEGANFKRAFTPLD